MKRRPAGTTTAAPAGTVLEHDTCMDVVFPRMAWVAGVDEVIAAIEG